MPCCCHLQVSLGKHNISFQAMRLVLTFPEESQSLRAQDYQQARVSQAGAWTWLQSTGSGDRQEFDSPSLAHLSLSFLVSFLSFLLFFFLSFLLSFFSLFFLFCFFLFLFSLLSFLLSVLFLSFLSLYFLSLSFLSLFLFSLFLFSLFSSFALFFFPFFPV